MHKVVINSYTSGYGGYGLSEAGAERFKELSGKEYHWCGPGFVPRHDPILVQVVEELGDAASCEHTCARLEIEEIEGTQYYIEEHEGYEILRTPEKMRWITIEGGE